jgi:MoaA/NifB/PqqE/SkfB family radical SAM enzyme
MTHWIDTGLHKAFKFRRLLLKKRSERPHDIQIEVTNRCNLDCDMCPRLDLLAVPEVDMQDAVFERILAELDRPRSVTLTGWGEPLMHPGLFRYIAALKARFPACHVSFTTNGYLLDTARIDQIIASGVERVTVSLEELPFGPEAPAAESTNPRKGHANHHAREGHPATQRVVDGLRALASARSNGRPELRLQVVMFPGSENTALKLVDFAAEIGFESVNLVRLDPRGQPELSRPSWAEERAIITAVRARARARGIAVVTVNDHGPLMRMASHSDSFCMRLDDYVYIDVEGQVAPCCLLRGSKVGSLAEANLDELWNSPGLERFYGPELPQDCDGCDAFMHNYRATTEWPAPLKV